MGTAETTVIAQRMVMGATLAAVARASAVVLAALELFCVVASFIFSRYCRVYRFFLLPQYRYVSNQLFHAPTALDAARQLMECLLPRRDTPFAVRADDYGAYMMLCQLRGRRDLAMPEVRALAERDREDDSLYCLTLYTYLICHRSLQETCARLFTHRNTVLYRVRRMREDFNIPIDDPDRQLSLLLSSALMLLELGHEDAVLPGDSEATGAQ